MRTVAIVLLGLAGLAAAVGIGLAANAITGDSVGLSAEPLSAGDELAPARRARDDRRDADERDDDDGIGRGSDSPSGGTTPVESDDDHGDDSGSGESGSGHSGSSDSGSDDSGSDDSGSSGSGGSDSGGSDSGGGSGSNDSGGEDD